MASDLELIVERSEGRVRLLSPAVGLFTCARAAGRVLTPGSWAGVLHVLQVPHLLRVPAGAAGRVVSARPERIHEPVGHGSVLYELAPTEEGGQGVEGVEGAAGAPAAGSTLAFRAPYSGRYWHRAAPGEPPLVAPGQVLAAGSSAGVIEVMKTFTLLHYAPGAGLPERARIARVAAADGAEVAEGEVLLELEPG